MTATEPQKPRGGARPGAGRKPLDQRADSVSMGVRFESTEQKAKFVRLGGARWLRQMIDAQPD